METGDRMVISKTLLAAMLGAALLLPSAARAQAVAAAAKPMELTAMDYFQIQQLVARYAQAIDTCSNSGYDYADLFTADGFFAPFTNGQIGRKLNLVIRSFGHLVIVGQLLQSSNRTTMIG